MCRRPDSSYPVWPSGFILRKSKAPFKAMFNGGIASFKQVNENHFIGFHPSSSLRLREQLYSLTFWCFKYSPQESLVSNTKDSVSAESFPALVLVLESSSHTTKTNSSFLFVHIKMCLIRLVMVCQTNWRLSSCKRKALSYMISEILSSSGIQWLSLLWT